MVGFQDGSIVMMDKDKDDNAFTTPTPPDEYRYRVVHFLSLLFGLILCLNILNHGRILMSILLLYFHFSFHATKPKHGRHNPISHWHISRKPINAFAFSPDLQHVAVVAADGELRIIDFRNERLIETFTSYFGALSCVCWSPDGKYILVRSEKHCTCRSYFNLLFLVLAVFANKVMCFFFVLRREDRMIW